MIPKRTIPLILIPTFAFFAFFTVFFFKSAVKQAALPVIGYVNDFELTDTDNKPFTLNQLRGKIWIADFFFTTCSGICPTMSKNMASLHRSYVLENEVHMVSFSVNPENDSPEVLAEHAKKFKADTRKWHFLTGARDAIQKVAVNSFKLGSIDEPVFHSGYFVLVDKKAQIRGYYDGTNDEEVQKLFKDTASLLKEK